MFSVIKKCLTVGKTLKLLPLSHGKIIFMIQHVWMPFIWVNLKIHVSYMFIICSPLCCNRCWYYNVWSNNFGFVRTSKTEFDLDDWLVNTSSRTVRVRAWELMMHCHRHDWKFEIEWECYWVWLWIEVLIAEYPNQRQRSNKLPVGSRSPSPTANPTSTITFCSWFHCIVHYLRNRCTLSISLSVRSRVEVLVCKQLVLIKIRLSLILVNII